MHTKSKLEIEVLRQGGRRLAQILNHIIEAVEPGVSTLALDQLAERLIHESGGEPSFKGYKVREVKIPFPGSLCTSINHEVVHGIPRKDRILKEGDIIGLDIGMRWPAVGQRSTVNGHTQGLYTDMAMTIGVGKISKDAERLLRITHESLDLAVNKVVPGVRTGDIGNTVQKFLEKNKLGVVRDLAGHGVGYEVHEDPLIPNYGSPNSGHKLVEDMVIAIEPMATLGDYHVFLEKDQWTFSTSDGSLAAHFEHTLVVTQEGREVLTKV